MTHKDLTVIITTFKSEEKIDSCLDSIDQNVKIIVIENSDNISFKNYIESKYSNTECILTNENLGYGKANNIGLKKAKTKYCLILNPDTILGDEAINFFI
jgi:GT2 family glycosyltransferase